MAVELDFEQDFWAEDLIEQKEEGEIEEKNGDQEKYILSRICSYLDNQTDVLEFCTVNSIFNEAGTIELYKCPRIYNKESLAKYEALVRQKVELLKYVKGYKIIGAENILSRNGEGKGSEAVEEFLNRDVRDNEQEKMELQVDENTQLLRKAHTVINLVGKSGQNMETLHMYGSGFQAQDFRIMAAMVQNLQELEIVGRPENDLSWLAQFIAAQRGLKRLRLKFGAEVGIDFWKGIAERMANIEELELWVRNEKIQDTLMKTKRLRRLKIHGKNNELGQNTLSKVVNNNSQLREVSVAAKDVGVMDLYQILQRTEATYRALRSVHISRDSFNEVENKLEGTEENLNRTSKLVNLSVERINLTRKNTAIVLGRQPNLKTLSIVGAGVTAGVVVHILQNVKQLIGLYVNSNTINDGLFRPVLEKHGKHLKFFGVENCELHDTERIKNLLNNYKTIDTLFLSGIQVVKRKVEMVKTLDEGSNRQYIDIANEPLIPDDLDIENTTANNNNNAYNDVIDLESSEAYNTSSKNKLQSIFDVKTKKPNSETSAINNNTVMFNSNSKRADFNPLKRPYNQVSNDVSGYSPTSQHGTQKLRSALKKPKISAEPFLGLNWMSTEEFLEDSVDAQPHTNGQQNVIIHPSARLVVPISLTEAMNNPGGPNFVYEQQVYLRNKAQQQNQMQMRGRRQGQGRGQGEFFKDNQTVPAGKRVSFLGLLPDTSIQKDSANVAAVSNGSVNKNVLFVNSKKPASLVLPKRKSDPINNISTSTNNGSLYQNENKDIVVQKNNDATLASNIVNTNNLPAPAPAPSTSISTSISTPNPTPNPTPTPKPLPKKVEYIKLQVEIEEGKKQIFKYYENQDLNQTVLQFCQNFNLPNLVDGLKKLVKQKLAAKKRAKMNSLP